ncbi:MAG TPA: transglycosylase domain-containing protein, partial [Saprospiraceae bacterium]|nr:transglycosylase domain-containing protein [Saprospiraceae bacterium]
NWWRYVLYFIGGIFSILAFLFLLTWVGAFGKIPSKATVKSIRQPEASKIYSIDEKLMGKYYTKNRNTLAFEDIPKEFMTSLVATEDSRYWTHQGIDFRSWMRVFVKRIILQQESAGGGSTLSQQLAKNLFPRKNYWFASMLINKYREWIVANRLENVYSKEELLTFYINTVPFGENIFGLDAAADRYFSKTADQLTIEESAMLVGLLKATSYYNPRNFPERALKRRNVVLQQMAVNHVIDSLTLDSLTQLPLTLSYQRNTDSEGIALYFRNQIRPILLEWCSNHTKPNGEPYNLYTDGLKVYTTIDFGMQQFAEEAAKSHLKKLQEIFDKQFTDWEPYQVPLMEGRERSDRYQSLKKKGMAEDDIIKSFDEKVSMKWWTWDGVIDTVATPNDSLKHHLKILQGSFVAIEPKTGGVLAWVGGNDAQQFNIDYVMTRRHPGSAFKPFLYATAIEQGIDPCTFYMNQQRTYKTKIKDENWTPRNADNQYGGYYSLVGALAKSINTIAVQLLIDTGIDAVIQKARRMGIKGEMEDVPSLALGTAEVTLIELVNAYTTFLNKGVFKPYMLISRIEDADGNILEEFKPPTSTQVFTAETVGILNQMMSNVIDRGTAGRLRSEFGVKGALAGKTGTTQFQSDGLFVGMSPKFLAGAWVGCFDRRVSFNSLRDGQGGKTALPIWGEFVKRLQQDPVYTKAYFNAWWPEEYRYVNDCPFSADISQLIEIEPDNSGDSISHKWPRQFIFRTEQQKGIEKLFENLFGSKVDKKNDPVEKKQSKKEEREEKRNERKKERDFYER